MLNNVRLRRFIDQCFLAVEAAHAPDADLDEIVSAMSGHLATLWPDNTQRELAR